MEAAPVASVAVLDMAREQQRSDDVRRKSRAEWERGASGETWFLLDAKAGIRVGEDGVRRTWRWCCMAGAWGLAGGGATAWPRVASEVMRQPARSVKRLVPLTCGPSGLFEFPMIFNHSNFEIQNGDLIIVQNSPNFA
jgi:hypothetical protein